MEEAVKLPDAADRGFELLAADTVREVNPALRGDFLGGLLCRADGIAGPARPPGPARVPVPRGRLRVAARPRGHRRRTTRCPRPHGRVAPRRPCHPLHRRPFHRTAGHPPARDGGARRPFAKRDWPTSRSPPDAADGPLRGNCDDVGGRRRLAALLPRLRGALPGVSRPAAGGCRHGARAAADGAAPRRRADDRRHPRVRRAVRVRRGRGRLRPPAGPRAGPARRAPPAPSAAGQAFTARSSSRVPRPSAACTIAAKSPPASSW